MAQAKVCKRTPPSGSSARWPVVVEYLTAEDIGASPSAGRVLSTTDGEAMEWVDASGGGPHTHAQADVTGLVTALAGKCATDDARLSDARAPTAHGHASSEVTGLDAALAARELATNKAQANGYASLDGTGKVPAAQLPSSSVTIKQTEIDFGADAVDGATFIVADADVQAGSKIIGSVAYAAPTGKDISELDGEGLDVKLGVHSAGNLWIRARGQQSGQRCYGKWKINYLVG